MGNFHNKIANFVKIHTIPNVLNALLEELGSEDASSASIAKIIKNDISLTARILRVANSPFYHRQSNITTIDSAVTLLGQKAVKALALSVSMFEITNSDDNRIIKLQEFWRHNLEVAVIARDFAGRFKGLQPEEAFVCGLIHDLGILFFIQEFDEKYQNVLDLVENEHELEEAEVEVLGIGHAEAGSMIASEWKLPHVICESIANHHKKDISSLDPEDVNIWQIVNLAHRYCHSGIDVSKNISANIVENRHEAARVIGLDTQAACDILAKAPELIIEAAAFLDVNIGDPIEILEDVNEKLGKLYEEYEQAILENEKLHKKIVEQEKNRAALEALKTTLATFSHYVNNATAAIVGRAQILDLYLSQGKLDDPDGKISHSIKIISESVDTICAVLDELKEFPEFKTVAYHGTSRILDIDKNVKARLGRLA